MATLRLDGRCKILIIKLFCAIDPHVSPLDSLLAFPPLAIDESKKDCVISKGQLISEWIYEIIISPNTNKRNVKISALTTQGRNPDNFFVLILGETKTS